MRTVIILGAASASSAVLVVDVAETAIGKQVSVGVPAMVLVACLAVVLWITAVALVCTERVIEAIRRTVDERIVDHYLAQLNVPHSRRRDDNQRLSRVK